MERVSISTRMVIFIKAISIKAPDRERGDTNGAIKVLTKVIGKPIRCTDMENTRVRRVSSPKDGFKTINLSDELK